MRRILCVYTSSFALFSLLSIFLGKLFCIVMAVLLFAALVVTPFVIPKISKTLFRNVFIGLLFILLAVLVAYFVTLPKLDSAKKYDGKFITAEGTVKSVKFSDQYTISVVGCDTVNGQRTNERVTIITRNESVQGIDIGMRVSFGGEAEFDDSSKNKGSECFLSVFPTYCRLLGTDGILGRFIYNSRERIRDIIENMDNTALLKAMLIGDKSEISEELNNDFKKLGTSHVLAISGLHLSIVVMTFYGMVSSVGIPNKPASALSILLSLFYMLIAGSSLSLVRSAQMMAIFFLSKLIRRKKDGITSLFLAGFVILLISQWSMYNVGFLLSFFATFGILVFVEPITRAYRKYHFKRRESGIRYSKRQAVQQRLLDNLISASATSVSATVCTLPIMILTFNEFSVFFLIGNLVTLVFVKYFLITAFSSVLLQCIGINIISFPLTFASEIFGKLLIAVTEGLSNMSPDMVSLRPYYLTAGGIIAIIIVSVFVCKSRNWRSLPVLTLILVLYVPAFNLVSDGLIYNTAVIDTVATEGANTTIVRWQGNSYLLDQTSSDSQRMSGLNSVIIDEGITYVDKAVFITDGESIDKRLTAFLTLTKVGEVTVMTDGDADFNSLRGICEENGAAFRVVYGADFSVADGITAHCNSGIATAFVIENGDNSFSVCRQYSDDEYVREVLNTDTTVFYGRSQPAEIQTSPDGHYRLNE